MKSRTAEEIHSLKKDRDAALLWLEETSNYLEDLHKKIRPPTKLEDVRGIVDILYTSSAKGAISSMRDLVETESRKRELYP